MCRKSCARILAVAVTGLFLGAQVTMGEAKGKEEIPAGIIEGFYGAPWTHETRLEALDFLKEVGMDAYIYAPKGDPYHRAAWHAPYPVERLTELQELVRRAKRNKVKFILAVSPGLSLRFTGAEGERDFADLMMKLRTMHAIGVSSFAVFFDDIENRDGAAQAAFLNRVERAIQEEGLSEDPLLTVPVEYAAEDMMKDGEVTPYTRDFTAALSKSIDVFYTGDGIAKSPLTPASAREVAALYGRRMTIWWNYPVNDYMEEKWALGAIEWISPEVLASVKGIYYNPMSNWRLSRLALRTGADFANDPARYDREASMERALEAEFGRLAPAMRVVARHSQRLENHWAGIGDIDAPALQAQTAAYWSDVEAGVYPKGSIAKIKKECKAIHRAVKALQDDRHGLDASTRQALAPQLARLEALAGAAETVLLYAQAKEEKNDAIAGILYADAARQAEALKRTDENVPRISENALESFIQRAVIQYAAMER